MLRKSGFTLIELLLTISLITITAGVATSIIISITRGYTKTQSNNELEMTANFILLKLEKELRSAIAVNPPVVDDTSVALTFKDKNNEIVTYTVVFPNDTTPGSIKRKYGSGSELNITDNNQINGVNVTCKTVNGATCFKLEGSNPQRVTIGMYFSQPGTGTCPDTAKPEKCVDLTDTIVVRGTY